MWTGNHNCSSVSTTLSDNFSVAFSRIQTKKQAECTDPQQREGFSRSVDIVHALCSLLDDSVHQCSSHVARNMQQKYANQVYWDMPAPWFYSIFQIILKALCHFPPVLWGLSLVEITTFIVSASSYCQEILFWWYILVVGCSVVATLLRHPTQLATDSGERKLYFNILSENML